MASLAELPPEVVTAILGQVGLEDLAAVRRTSRWLRGCVTGNAQLYRRLYLAHFDPPPTAVDWEREIRDFERFQSVCRSEDPAKLPLVLRVVQRLLQRSPRLAPDADADTQARHRRFRNADALSRLLNTPSNHAAFFAQSRLYERVRAGPHGLRMPGEEEADDDAAARRARHQQAAELHCLLGAVLLVVEVEEGPAAAAAAAAAAADKDEKDPPRRRRAAYPFAVAKVYDLREHTRESRWGPFAADGSGRVDWEKVEAALVVLRANVRRKGLLKLPVVGVYWNHTFAGSWAHSYVPVLHTVGGGGEDGDGEDGEGADSLDAQDPYGVTGIWMRLVSFLDYSDFFRFNFPFRDRLAADVPRPAFAAEEDLRLMAMELRVTDVEPAGADDHADFPVVRFAGTSHSLHSTWDANASSGLRGRVRTTPDGHVHWTVLSVVDGQPRWCSESVQIGGLRSGRGAVGYWFDAGYDPQGPCGPTAFWKLHEHRVPADAFPADGAPPQPFAYLLESALFGGGDGGGSGSGSVQHHRPNVLGVGGLLMGQEEEGEEEGEDEDEGEWEEEAEEDEEEDYEHVTDEDYVDDGGVDGLGGHPLAALTFLSYLLLTGGEGSAVDAEGSGPPDPPEP